VWGTTARKATVALAGGTLLCVTRSLRRLLPRIAQYCETQLIWIDQVCINQEDLEERSQQVSIMGTIYSQSESVIIWPGPVETLSPELRSVFCKAHRQPIGTTQPSVQEHIAAVLLHIRSAGWYEASYIVVFNELKAILRSTWFTRGWVFQKVVLPQRSKFIISPTKGYHNQTQHTKNMVLSLAQLYCAFSSLSSNYVATAKELGNAGYVNTPRTLIDMYHHWAERQNLEVRETDAPLYRVLSMVSSGAKTSNDLDRLYAFFGLNIDSSITLRPNYSFDLRRALISTVTSIIKGTSMLDIFDIIPRVSGSGNLVSVPSWVPYLLDEHLVTPFQISSTMVRAARDGDAGSESTEVGVYLWRGTCTGNQLHVRGRVIDIL
jgi:hypothetical protein